MKNIILADEFLKCIKQKEDITWDEFFNRFNIKGSDFLIAAILKQAQEKTL